MTFLIIWLAGDVFNLLGVIMQDLLITMVIHLMLFISIYIFYFIFYVGDKLNILEKSLSLPCIIL